MFSPCDDVPILRSLIFRLSHEAYLAISNGRTVGGRLEPNALEQCLTIMEDYGAEVSHLDGYVHPVSLLASRWQCAELSVVLLHCNFRYPIRTSKEEEKGISVGAFFHYPGR